MRVHFSCKISNTLINFLELQGEDFGPLYEKSHLPLELLSDSSRWVPAPDMEAFLELIVRMPWRGIQQNVLVQAGHEGPSIRAWGVLDSVLRMMPRPQEILNQPENFLSYFISPKPPIENIVRDENSISFDLPLPAEQYPLVTTYLKAAFESLPLYVDQPLAKCEWENITIKIRWNNEQKSLLPEDAAHQVSPALIQNLISDLQSNQRDLEDERKCRTDLESRISEQEKTIRKLRETIGQLTGNSSLFEIEKPAFDDLDSTFDEADTSPYHQISQNLARLHDYMVRAQQLITMLTTQRDMSPQLRLAMKRVDWDYVKTQYPHTVSDCMEALRKLKSNNNAGINGNAVNSRLVENEKEIPHV